MEIAKPKYEVKQLFLRKENNAIFMVTEKHFIARTKAPSRSKAGHLNGTINVHEWRYIGKYIKGDERTKKLSYYESRLEDEFTRIPVASDLAQLLYAQRGVK